MKINKKLNFIKFITFCSILFFNCSVIQNDPWIKLEPLPLDPEIELKIDEILSKLTLEQKVGQVIQGDSDSVTPEDVKNYRLGSVLSGGNSAPGPLPYAQTKDWLEMADKYFNASVDDEGVEIAVPLIWGIDAVHGHANLKGAIIFPHNVGLGAMNNPELIQKISQITAYELTVSGHDWTFAPTLAVPMDLRWGRAYEGFSENPEIVKSYGEKVVIGLQGQFGSKNFMGDGKVISSAKHFLADGATENGVDQGDALISVKELSEVHAAGYYSSIPAGVQTIMASFSSWNGRKLHGDKEILTTVVKEKLGFNGFIVGDWNGHGQVPGCINTDCPQSLNAGLDMYMAPDSWKGLYESTLKHVKDGTISIDRLNDAVRRILRVKIISGIFEKGKPSLRPNAGEENLLAKPENRNVARQAVRESLVLLKNNNKVLPIDPSKTILVIGDGAQSISKASGGWTLSWQGNNHSNDEFPNGTSILDGIKDKVNKAGGTIIFSEDGKSNVDVDFVIAVYGEDPYAEFQGDRQNLDFVPNSFDTNILKIYKNKGIPVVSVFLSGRPMWTNPEINNSDSFVAAWLPGSEGDGVSEMLFRSDPSFEFTGRLSFSWPLKASVLDEKENLFDLGYGLEYESNNYIGTLSEVSGLSNVGFSSSGQFFIKGSVVSPWDLWLVSGDLEKQIASFPTSVGGLIVSKTDHLAQEDALRINWTTGEETRYTPSYEGDYFRISTLEPDNMSRQSNGAMKLTFNAKSFNNSSKNIFIGQCDDSKICDKTIEIEITSDWEEYMIPLKDFEKLGVNMSKILSSIFIKADSGVDLGLSNVRLE
tara:strand:- start:2020 stop:4473 length:2454 start_codon:yes stop_codon:yes gene_type:complete